MMDILQLFGYAVLVVTWGEWIACIRAQDLNINSGDFGKHKWSPYIKHWESFNDFKLITFEVAEGVIELDTVVKNITYHETNIEHVILSQPYASHLIEQNKAQNHEMFKAKLIKPQMSMMHLHSMNKRSAIFNNSNATTPAAQIETTHATTFQKTTQQSTTTSQKTTTPQQKKTSQQTTSQSTIATTPAAPQETTVSIIQVRDLDRETKSTYILSLSTYSGSWELVSKPTIIVVNVTDINDNGPIFEKSSLRSVSNTTVKKGEVVGQVIATDKDDGANSELSYSIIEGTQTVEHGNTKEILQNNWVDIVPSTGTILLIANISTKMPANLTFDVIVKDNGAAYIGNRAIGKVAITFADDVRPWTDETTSAKASSSSVLIGSILGAITLIIFIVVALGYIYRKRKLEGDVGQLNFMLDDRRTKCGGMLI